MKLGRRRRTDPLPADLEATLRLDRREQVLAVASTTDDRWCVGTASALYVSGDPGWVRTPWEHIERGEWDTDSSTLTIVEVTDWGKPEVPRVLELTEAGLLLDLVRERVTKSVAITVFAAVYGRKGLTVVGRRAPTGQGEIVWSYVLAAGLDPDDPLVTEVAERTLGEARAELAWL